MEIPHRRIKELVAKASAKSIERCMMVMHRSMNVVSRYVVSRYGYGQGTSRPPLAM
ncbi:hypothetical protein I8G32_02511 [Rhodopseudomonas palustris]|nr:hypothetical protein I8G32_02511 [Rhodopseudomonas palustris]